MSIKWMTVNHVDQMNDSFITMSIKWMSVCRPNDILPKDTALLKKANERVKITTLSADSRLLEKGLSTSSMVRHLWLQYIVWRHKIELRCINQFFEKRAGVGQGILTEGEGSVQLTSLY